MTGDATPWSVQQLHSRDAADARVAMVNCQPLLLTALTVTTGLLGMGSRGLQVIDPDLPSEAVGPESPSRQVLQDEVERGSRLESDTLGGSCGDAAPCDGRHDLEEAKTTIPFNTTKEEPADDRSGRVRVSSSRGLLGASPSPIFSSF